MREKRRTIKRIYDREGFKKAKLALAEEENKTGGNKNGKQKTDKSRSARRRFQNGDSFHTFCDRNFGHSLGGRFCASGLVVKMTQEAEAFLFFLTGEVELIVSPGKTEEEALEELKKLTVAEILERGVELK